MNVNLRIRIDFLFGRDAQMKKTKIPFGQKKKILYKTRTQKNQNASEFFEYFYQFSEDQNIYLKDPLDNRPNYHYQSFYKTKFFVCIFFAFIWLLICLFQSKRWIIDLSSYTNIYVAFIIVMSIAIIPGFMNMYLILSFFVDKREKIFDVPRYPDVTLLIAAYNEEENIERTLNGLKKQKYPAKIQIILIDDGSQDKTVERAKMFNLDNLTILNADHKGKANALNFGLLHAHHDYIITVDADTVLDQYAIFQLMHKLMSSPKNTIACAGAVYVKNESQSMITKLQFWDYFLAISIIKRAQSFLYGTLVAQGAFSAYKKSALFEINGWPEVVGEDIVLTWALLDKGYDTTYAESALAFTSAPQNYRKFFSQRSRWARGLIESFRKHKRIFLKKKFFVFFIYWNLAFIFIDLVHFAILIPSILSCAMGYFFIFGPFLLLLILISFFVNMVYFLHQKRLFKSYGYLIKINGLSFLLYVMFYQYLMNFPVVYGYYLEFFNRKKSWGTK